MSQTHTSGEIMTIKDTTDYELTSTRCTRVMQIVLFAVSDADFRKMATFQDYTCVFGITQQLGRRQMIGRKQDDSQITEWMIHILGLNRNLPVYFKWHWKAV